MHPVTPMVANDRCYKRIADGSVQKAVKFVKEAKRFKTGY